MPLKLAVPPAARHLQRSFHTSALRCNHYDTLKVPQNASAKDIKKSFYALSKTHHPDHNPTDPEASTRFVNISEAYAILGHPEKRARYDRDVLRTHDTRTVPTGSYHSSSGPAGGRPASGLSRRRTHFQGPPPSFYRSGGWGAHGAKRKAAAEGAESGNFTGGDGPNGPGNQDPFAGGREGGMGFGQSAFGNANDVPHFDRESHFRTHENHEKRRRGNGGREARGEQDGSMGTFANFVFVSGVIGLGIAVPSIIMNRMSGRTVQRERGK